MERPKFADYVKKYQEADPIEQEIEQAAENTEQRQEQSEEQSGFEMPEQFRGKSAEDIAKSYTELQKLQSRQAQELGEVRRLTDQLLQSQLSAQASPGKPPAPEPKEEPVTVDTLYDDTEGTIARVAEKRVGSRIEAIEKRFEERERQESLEAFTERRPNWRETAQSEEFLTWMRAEPRRVKLATAADQYDLDAAELLFELWDAHQGAKAESKDEKERKRKEQLKAAQLETPSASRAPRTTTYSRQNILIAKTRANQGDEKARAWLREHSADINAAYAEGRIEP